MSPTFLNKKRIKLRGFSARVRKIYYKALGLTFGESCVIGRIVCDWPNNVVLGANCVILDDVVFGIGYGFENSNVIKIGNRVFIGYNVEFNCTSSITIGDDVLIAAGTKIVNVNHNFKLGELINKQSFKSLPIIIEDDVWIAANCVIVGGVSIGKGSIVGAGSVVTKSIPPNEVWGGVPAKFVKPRQ